MKTVIPKILFLFFIGMVQAQVGINTTNPDAVLDIRSTNQATPSNTDGLLIPKIDEFPITNPTAAQDGMMVYVTGNGTPTKGFYYWDQTGSLWINVVGVRGINDLLDGRTDGSGSSIFLGQDAGMNDDGTNNQNLGVGYQSLQFNTSGIGNIGIGFNSLNANTTGESNIAMGVVALLNNTVGSENIAIGPGSLPNHVDGFRNIALGFASQTSNISGNNNIGIGVLSLMSNVSGDRNVAIGTSSLSSNNSGSGNIAIGYQAASGVTLNNRLYVENSNSSAPLIYGEFDNDILGFNGDVAIGHQAPNAKLHALEEGTANNQTIVAILESDTSNRPT